MKKFDSNRSKILTKLIGVKLFMKMTIRILLLLLLNKNYKFTVIYIPPYTTPAQKTYLKVLTRFIEFVLKQVDRRSMQNVFWELIPSLDHLKVELTVWSPLAQSLNVAW